MITLVSVTHHEFKEQAGMSGFSLPRITGLKFKQVKEEDIIVTGTVPFDGGEQVVGVLPDGTPVAQQYNGTWHQSCADDTGEFWAWR